MIISIVLSIALCLPACAQTRMADLIRTMPDSILPLLSKNDRLDFVDYLENNAQARLKNKLGSECEMTKLTIDYAHIQMSRQSEVAMKLLNMPDSGQPVFCMVTTYKVDSLEDSRIQFFSCEWEQLPASRFIDLPDTDDFIKLQLSDTSTDLIVTRQTIGLLPEGEKRNNVPVTTVLSWNGQYRPTY